MSDAVKSLNNGKSTGLNSIPIKIFKIFDCYISAHLSILSNESFLTWNFPNKLKVARVTPISKKGLSTKISNYRPFSLWSNFSILIQKLMHRRLYRFLEVHDILLTSQFGFCNGHSTDHALVNPTENIKVSLD